MHAKGDLIEQTKLRKWAFERAWDEPGDAQDIETNSEGTHDDDGYTGPHVALLEHASIVGID